MVSQISPMIEKALLKTIEKKNVPRNQVNVGKLLDSNVEVFGKSGSQLRRELQTHWYNIKRQSIRRYHERLLTYAIRPSAATMQELSKEGRCPSPESAVTMDVGSINSGDDGAFDLLIKDFSKSLQVATPPRQQPSMKKHEKQVLPSSPCFESNLANKFGFLPSQMTANQKPTGPLFSGSHVSPPATIHTGTMAAPSPAPSVASASSASFSYATLGSEYNKTGTEYNPEVIQIDLKFPENHYPFLVERNPKRVCNGWNRETLHIKKVIAVSEMNGCWRAKVEADGKAIIIQGPSVDGNFHLLAQNPSPADVETDIKHVSRDTLEKIEQSPIRKWKYWKLVLPSDWVLDNVCLSASKSDVALNIEACTKVVEGVEVNIPFAQWEIARLTDDSFRVGQNQIFDPKTLFGKKN